MEFRALFLLPLLGLLAVDPGFGQREDINIGDWLNSNVELIKNLESKVKNAERWQDEVQALKARFNVTVDELMRQKAEVDRLKRENEGLQTRLNATVEEIDKMKQSSPE